MRGHQFLVSGWQWQVGLGVPGFRAGCPPFRCGILGHDFISQCLSFLFWEEMELQQGATAG